MSSSTRFQPFLIVIAFLAGCTVTQPTDAPFMLSSRWVSNGDIIIRKPMFWGLQTKADGSMELIAEAEVDAGVSVKPITSAAGNSQREEEIRKEVASHGSESKTSIREITQIGSVTGKGIRIVSQSSWASGGVQSIMFISDGPKKWFISAYCSVIDSSELQSFERAIQSMKRKRPNQSPEPTVMSVTPRAGARVAPATTVAHL